MSHKSKISNHKLMVGFITYGEASFEYLPFFLDSLFKQKFKDFSIIALDNSENYNENSDYIIDNYPQIKLIKKENNIGFARAYNKMIEEADRRGAEYFLAINPDVLMDENALGEMFEKISSNSKLGSLSPLVLQWDFENNRKTKVVDTCGIGLSRGLSFFDIGQGEDIDKMEKNFNVLGPSGAAGLYRMSALKKARDKHGYFDERMFMYKEDCDLAYRLFLLGFLSECFFDAKVYHDRTAKSYGRMNFFKTRRKKSKQVREWSFLNQHIIYLKHWSAQNMLNKFFILQKMSKFFIFALLFERFLLKQYPKIFSAVGTKK